LSASVSAACPVDDDDDCRDDGENDESLNEVTGV
jgi:hypothetical protein